MTDINKENEKPKYNKRPKRVKRERAYDLDPSGDGITHINIYSRGLTQLGKDLSNFSHHPFNHPEHGLFASVEGYWYWLTRQEDDLRHLYGFKAKELGRSLPEVKAWHPSQFSQYVRQALDAKLEKHPGLKKALQESTLPLEHYYTMNFGGKQTVVEPKGGDWVLAHFEKVRAEVNPHANMDVTAFIESKRGKKEEAKEDVVHNKRDEEQLGLF